MNRKEQQQAAADALVQENEWLKKNRISCRVCQGVGYVTVYRLVTYHGKSLQIKRTEGTTSHFGDGYEEAMRLARVLADPLPGADRQMVLSAAKECQCRKARGLV